MCAETDCTIPEGYCHCGCGGTTTRAKRTRGERGHQKGEYLRYRKQHHGEPFRYVVDENGCWIWPGSVTGSGYGVHRNRYAHRVSYEMHKGEIGPGLEIDHLCRVRACVNPAHLEAVTPLVNVRRGSATRFRRCEVEEIKRLVRLGVPKATVGRMFRTPGSYVWMICDGRAWKDVA